MTSMVFFSPQQDVIREKLTSSLRSSDLFEWEGWGDGLVIVKLIVPQNLEGQFELTSHISI